jgi:hypothetical protein
MPDTKIDIAELRRLLEKALADAYEQGCTDTHTAIQAEPELALMPVGDAEFGEAVSDYAHAAINSLEPIVAQLEQSQREVERLTHERNTLFEQMEFETSDLAAKYAAEKARVNELTAEVERYKAALVQANRAHQAFLEGE